MPSANTRISRRLFEAVKLDRRTARELAVAIGMHESQLSSILHGYRTVKRNDPRMVRLGKLVGVKREELFEEEPT